MISPNLRASYLKSELNFSICMLDFKYYTELCQTLIGETIHFPVKARYK